MNHGLLTGLTPKIDFFCLYQFGRHTELLEIACEFAFKFGISPFAEHGRSSWSEVSRAGRDLLDSGPTHLLRLHRHRHSPNLGALFANASNLMIIFSPTLTKTS